MRPSFAPPDGLKAQDAVTEKRPHFGKKNAGASSGTPPPGAARAAAIVRRAFAPDKLFGLYVLKA
jgi:hypothetical protein